MCPSCNLDLPLFNGLCGQCNAKQLDRLKSACQHTVDNWRQGAVELGDSMFPPTVAAKTVMNECANFLEKVLTSCCTKS